MKCGAEASKLNRVMINDYQIMPNLLFSPKMPKYGKIGPEPPNLGNFSDVSFQIIPS